jgi:hypothetical protein
LEGLLAKLRDPSFRNLDCTEVEEEKNQIMDADEDMDMKPVSRRSMFAKLKTNNRALRHASMSGT